jgi:hypothetical protein
MKPDKGDEIEDLVEEASSSAFLTDFVVRNPKFKKQSGELKEAADFLVPFSPDLLAFQVKSKIEEKPGSEKTRVDFDRIHKRIDKGIKQLNTIRRAISANQIQELQNARGIRIPFEAIESKKLIGIVILELIGEEKLPEEERTALYGGYTYQHDMPVHIFRLSDYREIVKEIDTIPDFVDYLKVRQLFYERNIMGPMTEELDYLAIFKTQPEIIQKCLNGECDYLMIQEDTWKGYIADHEGARKTREKLNRPSLVIDEIINHLHESIGHNPKLVPQLGNTKADQGTVENYFLGVTELSKLTRITRRIVGEKLLDKMKKADKTGHGHGLILNQKENTAILVLSSNRPQHERGTALYNLCSIAYCKLGLMRITGISTDPLHANGRSYEALTLDDVEFENHTEIATQFESAFGSISHYRTFEYGDGET